MNFLKLLTVAGSLALLTPLLHAQSDYTVTERGLNHTVYEKTTVENATNHVYRYTELATGLNYTNQWGHLWMQHSKAS